MIEGNPATFTCELGGVSSDMPVTWLKDGKTIPADSKDVEVKTVGNVLSLHIPATVLDDEAEYAVVVGKSRSKAELLVDGMFAGLCLCLCLLKITESYSSVSHSY